MNNEIAFLTVEEVIEIHDDQIAQHGGTLGLRDKGTLESAVRMPQQGFGGKYLHNDLFDMAAAYAFHIAENQPFLDGNKRTGLVTALTFLAINGIVLKDPKKRLYSALMAVAGHQLDKSGLGDIFRDL